jgi:hypothetical protein
VPTRNQPPEVRAAVGRVMTLARLHGSESPQAHAARQDLRAAVLSRDIRAALAAGLLSDAHRRDLAVLLTWGEQ